MTKLLFLDTETTGFDDPKLVQLAFHINGSGLFSHGIYNPGKEIHEGAVKIHGITNEVAQAAPKFSNCLEYEVLQNLLDEYVLVCHNAVFDIKVLQNEGLRVKKSLCTYLLAKKLLPYSPKHKLQFLRESLNLNIKATAHDALGDVLVMKALFMHLINGVKTKNGSEAALHLIQNSIVNHE